jgi:hypothetical protein
MEHILCPVQYPECLQLQDKYEGAKAPLFYLRNFPMFFFFSNAVGEGPIGTVVTVWPIVPAPDVR